MPKVKIFQVDLKLTVNLITQRKNPNVVDLTLKTLSLKGGKKDLGSLNAQCAKKEQISR